MSEPDDGLRKVYSPVNQAWLVMWHESVLRVFNTEGDADAYMDYLRGGRDYGEGAVWAWPKPGEGGVNGLSGVYEDWGARTGARGSQLSEEVREQILDDLADQDVKLGPWLETWNHWYDASHALCQFLSAAWKGPCFPDLLIFVLADEGVPLPGLEGSVFPEQVRAELERTTQLWLPHIPDAIDYMVDYVIANEAKYIELATTYLDAQEAFAAVHEELRLAVETSEHFPGGHDWDPVWGLHELAMSAWKGV